MKATQRDEHIRNKTDSLSNSIKYEDPEKIDPTLAKYRQIIDSGQLVKLDPLSIKTNENIRKKIDVESREFKQLVASIEAYGILQSIVVEYRETSSSAFDLVCVSGHRRLEALKQSTRKEKIPAKLVTFNRKGASVGIALSENVNRQNLHFVELADSYLFLNKQEEMSTKELAERFDKNERTVTTYLKMAGWSAEIKAIILDSPQVFSLRYIWDNFAKKNVSEGQMLRLLKTKLSRSKNNDSKLAADNKSTAKLERKKKLKTYFVQEKVSAELQEGIVKALEFLRLV